MNFTAEIYSPNMEMAVVGPSFNILAFRPPFVVGNVSLSAFEVSVASSQGCKAYFFELGVYISMMNYDARGPSSAAPEPKDLFSPSKQDRQA